MSKTVTDVKLENYIKGMQSNYSHYVASPNSWAYLENFDMDRQGVLQNRTNTFLTGTSTTDFYGAGVYEKGGTTSFLLKSGTTLYTLQANSTSTSAYSGTAAFFTSSTAIARFDTIQGNTVVACDGDYIRYTANGTTASAFATVGLGMPTNVDIVAAGFVGRIWAAIGNNTPSTFIQDQVYYSDVIPAGGLASTTGTGQFIKVNTQGKWITGLVQFNNVLYVFTTDSIFRIYNTQSVDNAPFANVGAIRQESIVKTFDGVFFYHYSGVYKLDASGITKISQDIDDIIQKINIPLESPGSSYTKRVFSFFDDQAIYFSIDYNPGWGSQSVDIDRTYIIRYNYSYKIWTMVTLKDFRLSWAISKYFSTNLNGIVGLANVFPIIQLFGQSITTPANFFGGLFDTPTYYDGSKPFESGSGVGEPLGDWTEFNSNSSSSTIRPIMCNGETQWLDFGTENHQKTINGISIASENAEGFQLLYQIDNDEDQKSDRRNAVWKSVGTLGSDYVTFFMDFKSKPFYRIKFKISGQSLGITSSIGKITFLKITDEGYGKN